MVDLPLTHMGHLIHSTTNNYNVQIPLQDDRTSSLQWRFHEKKSFAGIGIQTHDLLISIFLLGSYLQGFASSGIDHLPLIRTH